VSDVAFDRDFDAPHDQFALVRNDPADGGDAAAKRHELNVEGSGSRVRAAGWDGLVMMTRCCLPCTLS